KDFCENPEIVRERLARNRHSKFVARSSNKPKPQGDVVGNPKGQGQDANTQQSRHKKDVHKSTRANHNRRQGAAFKRNRGMIPS
ncbi:Activating signal cointegrator 1 complex subunit 2, partial [Pseudolycoriella hygida]